MAFSRGGKTIALDLDVPGQGEESELGAFARAGTIRFNHGTTVVQVAYSPDGRFLASRGDDGTVCVWDPSTGREIRRLGQPRENLRSISFAPGGETIALDLDVPGQGEESERLVQTIVLIDVKSGRELGQEVGPRRSFKIKMDASGRLPPPRLPDSRYPFDDERLQKSQSAPDTLVGLSDVATGQGQRSTPVRDGTDSRGNISPDGRWRAVKYSNSVQLVDTKTDRKRWEITPRSRPLCLKFSIDGSMLALGGHKQMGINPFIPSAISLWDVETGRLIREIAGNVNSVQDLTFSPDGKSFASCSHDENAVRVWNVADGKELLVTDAPLVPITTMAVSPDGESIVTVNQVGTIRAWDRTNGKRSRVIGQHEDAVAQVVFTPDGEGLVTGGWKGSRFWDFAAGREVRRYADDP